MNLLPNLVGPRIWAARSGQFSARVAWDMQIGKLPLFVTAVESALSARREEPSVRYLVRPFPAPKGAVGNVIDYV